MGYITISKMTSQVNSNFCTSKLDGKSYCMVYDTLVFRYFYSRLATNGLYDNFSSQPFTNNVGWTDFRINCGTGSLYGLGGSSGSSGNSNFTVVDTFTGNASFVNITGLPQVNQNGVCLTLNNKGECFVIFNCSVNIFGQIIPPSAPAFIHNRIYKLNAAFNNFIWNAHTGYNSFSTSKNKRYFVSNSSNKFGSNGFNCLAANNQYLFYYDGFHIKAFNSSNGAVAGNADSVIGQQPLYSGGVYANACNEVFVGGVGGYVLKYKFNGTNFLLIDTLHIAGMQGRATYDIMCNPSNNMLYVSGDSFVAMLSPNSNCIDTSNLKLNIAACANKIILQTVIRDSTCSHQFIWYDTTAHTVVRSIIKSSGHFADTLYAPNTAHVYLVSITKLSACQIVKQSQYVHLFNPVYHIHKSIHLCFGNSYTLPSGIIVNASGIYNDTLAAHTGCDSIITTTVSVGLTYHFYNSIIICSNQHYILPNGISVNTSGIYNDTLLTYVGCDSIITTQLIVKPFSQKTFSATICQGNIYTLPGGQNVSTSGTYNSVYTNYVGCDSIIFTQLNVIQNSSSNQTIQACQGDLIILPDGQIAKYGGNYFSTLKNYRNCDSIIHTVILMYEKPIVNLGNDTSICEGNSIELDAGDNNNSTLNKYYSWNINNNQQKIVVANSGLYSVQVSSPPCKTVSDEINIQVKNCECKLILPNSFTPNNDGVDETFKPIIACDLEPQQYDFKIYNRLGQKVFSTTLFGNAWDGTFNGALQELGAYVFFVSFINPTTHQKEMYKGDVILLR
ncbi:MAG: hypothetical protein RJA07_2285 [Bacteroidota bacterium]|jgi:gliding motility-associated-like protein